MYMRQCKMVMVEPCNTYAQLNNLAHHSGSISQISYIPERFAKIGKILLFKESNFTQAWKVKEVYTNRRTIEDCNKRSQDYKKQRKASDI